MLWIWDFLSQNYGKTQFCCFKTLSLWQLVMAAQQQLQQQQTNIFSQAHVPSSHWLLSCSSPCFQSATASFCHTLSRSTPIKIGWITWDCLCFPYAQSLHFSRLSLKLTFCQKGLIFKNFSCSGLTHVLVVASHIRVSSEGSTSPTFLSHLLPVVIIIETAQKKQNWLLELISFLFSFICLPKKIK